MRSPAPEAARLAALSDDELIGQLAGLITEKLGQSVISSAIPAGIGDCIREACEHGAVLWRHTIPMPGPVALFAEYRFNPDGTLILQLQDTNGRMFWSGTFRPAA